MTADHATLLGLKEAEAAHASLLARQAKLAAEMQAVYLHLNSVQATVKRLRLEADAALPGVVTSNGQRLVITRHTHASVWTRAPGKTREFRWTRCGETRWHLPGRVSGEAGAWGFIEDAHVRSALAGAA